MVKISQNKISNVSPKYICMIKKRMKKKDTLFHRSTIQ